MAAKFKLDPFQIQMMFALGDWKGLGYEAECYFMEKADGAIKMGYVISPEMRLDAAKNAAKYLYAVKQNVDVTSNGQTIECVVHDFSSKPKDPG